LNGHAPPTTQITPRMPTRTLSRHQQTRVADRHGPTRSVPAPSKPHRANGSPPRPAAPALRYAATNHDGAWTQTSLISAGCRGVGKLRRPDPTARSAVAHCVGLCGQTSLISTGCREPGGWPSEPTCLGRPTHGPPTGVDGHGSWGHVTPRRPDFGRPVLDNRWKLRTSTAPPPHVPLPSTHVGHQRSLKWRFGGDGGWSDLARDPPKIKEVCRPRRAGSGPW
jgi:hypothetical protein